MTTPTPPLSSEVPEVLRTAEARSKVRLALARAFAFAALDLVVLAWLLTHAPLSVPVALCAGLPFLVLFAVLRLPLARFIKARQGGAWPLFWCVFGWVRLLVMIAPLWLLFGPYLTVSVLAGVLMWRVGMAALSLPLILGFVGLAALTERLERYLDENGPRL